MTKPSDALPPAKPGGAPPTLPTAPIDGPVELAQPGRDRVIALRIVGANLEFELSPHQQHFAIGSGGPPSTHVTISSKLARGDKHAKEHVSRFHVLAWRKDGGFWVRDKGSTNGTFYKGEPAEGDFCVTPGESFRIGNVTLLALDQQLRDLRAPLLWTLGLGAHQLVDEVIQVIAPGEPLVLLGEPDCEQAMLAQAIHRSSARRAGPFVHVRPPLADRETQEAVLAHGDGGTLFIDLAEFDELPAYLVRKLFDKQDRIRPILAAPDRDTADDHLGDVLAHRLREIRIPPLGARRVDVPRLFDKLLQDDGCKRPIAALGDDKIAALIAHHWEGNFGDLRKNLPRLRAVLEHDLALRAAARALGIKHQSLGESLKRIGLTGWKRERED